MGIRREDEIGGRGGGGGDLSPPSTGIKKAYPPIHGDKERLSPLSMGIKIKKRRRRTKKRRTKRRRRRRRRRWQRRRRRKEV